MAGWFQNLKNSLSKTSSKIVQGLTSLILKRKLDQEILDELEEILIMSDLGVEVSKTLIANLKALKFDQEITLEEIKLFLAEEIAKILQNVEQSFEIKEESKPFIIMMVGVNGAGKTTTVAKLCKLFKNQNKTVKCIAGDTFRAAGSAQLDMWGTRIGVEVVTGDSGTDPASLVYRGVQSAMSAKDDVLVVDTAGRLQNNAGLMDELGKIYRVIQKQDETAPHEVLLVLDATVGQNAHSQVELFSKIVKVSGLVIAKMDSSAKAGVIVGLAQKFKLPIYFMGLGEGAEDLEEFKAKEFSYGLLGLDIDGDTKR